MDIVTGSWSWNWKSKCEPCHGKLPWMFRHLANSSLCGALECDLIMNNEYFQQRGTRQHQTGPVDQTIELFTAVNWHVTQVHSCIIYKSSVQIGA